MLAHLRGHYFFVDNFNHFLKPENSGVPLCKGGLSGCGGDRMAPGGSTVCQALTHVLPKLFLFLFTIRLPSDTAPAWYSIPVFYCRVSHQLTGCIFGKWLSARQNRWIWCGAKVLYDQVRHYLGVWFGRSQARLRSVCSLLRRSLCRA